MIIPKNLTVTAVWIPNFLLLILEKVQNHIQTFIIIIRYETNTSANNVLTYCLFMYLRTYYLHITYKRVECKCIDGISLMIFSYHRNSSETNLILNSFPWAYNSNFSNTFQASAIWILLEFLFLQLEIINYEKQGTICFVI